MEDLNNILIGDKVKFWRKDRGLTQDSLAKNSSVPYTTIAKIESGVIKNPSIQTVVKIAQGLNILIDDLIRTKEK
jgi:transcriptional regulator with XRE-family HTH domain